MANFIYPGLFPFCPRTGTPDPLEEGYFLASLEDVMKWFWLKSQFKIYPPEKNDFQLTSFDFATPPVVEIIDTDIRTRVCATGGFLPFGFKNIKEQQGGPNPPNPYSITTWYGSMGLDLTKFEEGYGNFPLYFKDQTKTAMWVFVFLYFSKEVENFEWTQDSRGDFFYKRTTILASSASYPIIAETIPAAPFDFFGYEVPMWTIDPALSNPNESYIGGIQGKIEYANP